ncbi:metallophosphoesterase [Agrilactobacillus yilanensis]|uniref:Metallophosphoesterase n=1 Tax=Agrilactobacillus yilanensis TaxID=2485997 RepID=A0ABW4J6V2_9LACO|nr:metallophosphoesterase [Agrilactobacillus yilanensis]
MKWFYRVTLIIGSFILILSGILIYAFKIEPYRLKVTDYVLSQRQSDTLELKIVQISDLHLKATFNTHNLEKVVQKVNQQKPDVVVFTGDLYDNYAQYHDDQRVSQTLRQIKTKFGKFAVYGNHDYGGGAGQHYAKIMARSGFLVLRNTSKTITLLNHKKVLFTGLDEAMLGHPAISAMTANKRVDYRVLLMHEPGMVTQFLNYSYDIALSGHSHGGQIKVPGLPIVNQKILAQTALAETYSQGWYTLANNLQLFVNTGIGTSHVAARFGVVPEISAYHIYI